MKRGIQRTLLNHQLTTRRAPDPLEHFEPMHPVSLLQRLKHQVFQGALQEIETFIAHSYDLNDLCHSQTIGTKHLGQAFRSRGVVLGDRSRHFRASKLNRRPPAHAA